MSTDFIKKNSKLSIEFGNYVSESKDASEKIPPKAFVYFTVEGDDKFNAQSRSLISGRFYSTRKVVEARKRKNSWTINVQPRIPA